MRRGIKPLPQKLTFLCAAADLAQVATPHFGPSAAVASLA
jgi:hypothetical protein